MAASRSIVAGRGAGKSVAVLLDDLEHGYQAQVLSGIAAAARQHDLALFCFATGGLRQDVGNPQLDLFRQILAPRQVDGQILLTGTLASQIGLPGMAELANFNEGIPTISVGAHM